MIQAPPPAQAVITLCDSSTTNCTPATSFGLQSMRDLQVVVNWQNLVPGTHAQKVSFILPGGDLYQAFEMSFEVAGGSATTMQALPVTGTWITQRRLTGTWSVALELDGQPVGTQTVLFTP
jgi:hypothetical protein